ncbi:hypothetical protein NDU88_004852 [Pleurodeles waltl]|uniref:Uncharacterized protein n=1 Tax=Pleurodeles waltl TaxID=8319 RepID=A0AAV7VJE2_PLEWA|nr:hypothetical protein NDU88_004852 [Pleurodeles waltl]
MPGAADKAESWCSDRCLITRTEGTASPHPHLHPLHEREILPLGSNRICYRAWGVLLSGPAVAGDNPLLDPGHWPPVSPAPHPPPSPGRSRLP